MTGSDPRASLQGSVLGDFTVDTVLGAGGGGTVYSAQWGHREVALKVLRAELLPDATERRRFMDEARLLAEINHPGVVRILGFGELPDGRPYLAMERLEGESLAERIQRGPMDVDTALRLFDQVAQAVQTLHERGLIHRDIKPENIFLVQQERYAVLLDFGIAKPVDAPDSTVTRQGGVRGTPAYMAPERFFGAAANEATDIYELGVVLFAMLTAQLPWDASDDPVTRLNPRRPSDMGVPLPGRLEEDLLQAISTRGENRPPTMADFGARVAQSVAGVGRGGRRTADLDATGPRDLLDPQAPPAMTPGPTTGPNTAPTAGMGTAPTLAVSPTPELAATRPLQRGDSTPGMVFPAGHTPPPVAPAFTEAATTTNRAAGQTQPPLPPLPAPPRQRWPFIALTAGLLVIIGLVIALVFVLQMDRQNRPAPPATATAPDAGIPKVPKRGPAFDRLAWRLHARDTAVLIRVNHDELKMSTAYRAMMKGTQQKPNLGPFALLKKTCGLDLLEDTRWMSVGLSGKESDPDIDLVLQGRWTRERVEKCFRAFGDEKKGVDPIQRKGALTRVKFDEAHIWLAWPDAHTVMLSSRSSADEKWFRQRLTGRAAAHHNARLYAVYRSLDTTDTVWAINTNAGYARLEFLKGLPPPVGTYMSLRARKKLTLRAAGNFRSEADAIKAKTEVAAKLAKLKAQPLVTFLLDRTELTRDKQRLELALELEERTSGVFGAAVASSLGQVNWNFFNNAPPKTAPRPEPRDTP